MKELFKHKNFQEETMHIIKLCDGILKEYAMQGYDLSLRQLYYQLVARAYIENTNAMYKRLGSIVNNARLAGLLDWSMIVDRGRTPRSLKTWDHPAQIIKESLQNFRIDHWRDQPNYVEVMVEKEALSGVLLPVCYDLQIIFTANKGYSSASAMYRAGKRVQRRVSEGKDVHILYLGDHDPSGLDMDRDIIERLDIFSGQYFQFKRLALLDKQIGEMNIPENPTKLTDSRAKTYVRTFGLASWELDAMEPAQLARIVRAAVENLRDEDIYYQTLDEEEEMRERLREIVNDLEG